MAFKCSILTHLIVVVIGGIMEGRGNKMQNKNVGKNLILFSYQSLEEFVKQNLQMLCPDNLQTDQEPAVRSAVTSA